MREKCNSVERLGNSTTMAAKANEPCGKGLKEIGCMTDIVYIVCMKQEDRL